MTERYLTDRTSIETDWTCGEKYRLYKLEGGGGIVPVDDADPLVEGSQLHSDLHRLNDGVAIEEVLESLPAPMTNQVEMEVWCRRIGWAAAYARFALPFFSQNGFTHLKSEREFVLNRDPLFVAVTPDELQLDHANQVIYREYKSVSGLNSRWAEGWPFAIQVHLSLQAVQEEIGLPIKFGQVMGLEKGYNAYGRLVHPYVWVYAKGGYWQPKYKYGWDHAPVWEYPGGILKWVEECGEEIYRDVIGWSVPIYLNSRLVETVVEERIIRERIIARCQKQHPLSSLRRGVFEQRFSNCKPYKGFPCPYLAACHNAVVREDPLGSGLYKPRTPHHGVERMWK